MQFTPISDTGEKVSEYFIWFFQSHGDLITNLKLQKLLYFAQAWHLALYTKPLFEEKIEAWIHGPVVPSIYHRFKEYRYQPIIEPIKKPDLSTKIEKHLIEIIKVYAGHTAFELENITHNADPWIKARGNMPIDQASNEIISHSDMKTYYAKMAQ